MSHILKIIKITYHICKFINSHHHNIYILQNKLLEPNLQQVNQIFSIINVTTIFFTSSIRS
jgi:hypothetical protein